MASRATRRPLPLALVSTAFVLLWLFVAAFPFLWTAWGSFKVEADFFSRTDWLNAISAPQTIAQTGAALRLHRVDRAAEQVRDRDASDLRADQHREREHHAAAHALGMGPQDRVEAPDASSICGGRGRRRGLTRVARAHGSDRAH